MTKTSRRLFSLSPLLLLLVSGVDAALSGPRWIDEVGREVAFAFPPKRIVSLAPNTTEILFSLGLDGEIVGVSSDSNYPEGARKKTHVGSYLNPDLERVVSLKPDLVIATGAGNTRDIVDRLASLGIPSYVLFPKTFDDILKSIDHLGQAVDREKEAAAVVKGMQKRRDRIIERSRGLPRPRVFLLVGEAPVVTAGRGSFADDLIRLAGGENIAANEKEMYPRLGMEEILKRAPEIILVSSMNPKAEYSNVLKEWKRWKTLPAIRDNRVYVIDSDLVDRPSPRIIDGLEEMARFLHPEVFKK